MQIQPITNQPNFNGKFVFKESADNLNKFKQNQLYKMYNDVAALIAEKPYDIYVWENKNKPDFYNISANKSFEEAKKIKEYTVKIHSNVMAESIVDAAKEAMKMYEKYISKGIKG